VLNNPVRNVDPSGHCFGVLGGIDILICAGVVVFVAGTIAAVAASPNSGFNWNDYNWSDWSWPGSMVETGAPETGDQHSAPEKPSTLAPGPHAGESIPARGTGRDFTDAERADIDRIGRTTGCHTCGSTDPKTKSGHFIPDHQPPNELNPSGEEQRLFPHCLACSRKQGGDTRTLKYRSTGKPE